MRRTRRSLSLVPFVLYAAVSAALAGSDAPRGGPPRPDGPIVGSGVAAKDRVALAWYGTWDGALAEARRSGRAILLLAAAPQCAGGISGLW